MFEPLDYNADSVEQRHLCVWQVDLLHQGHQSLQGSWRIW
jgi:hypothetical protein